jgi:hypothetical protein
MRLAIAIHTIAVVTIVEVIMITDMIDEVMTGGDTVADITKVISALTLNI